MSLKTLIKGGLMMARSFVFFGAEKTSDSCVTEKNFDVNPHYFKQIAALGKECSRSWEVKVGKRIYAEREVIARAFKAFCALTKETAKNDSSAKQLYAELRRSARKHMIIGSEMFPVIEKGFSELRMILCAKNDSAKLDSLARIYYHFRTGRDAFEKARNELMEKNLRFPIGIVKKIFRERIGLTFSDVINEANLGLMRAAERYDYKTGFRFCTYAAWWIRQFIERAYANLGKDIHIPVHQHELSQKISRAQKNLYQRFASVPEAEEISATLGISPKDVLENAQMFAIPYSFDTEMQNESDLYLKDVMYDKNERGPEKLYAAKESALFLRQTLERELTPKERFIILRHFGLDGEPPQTLKGIGDIIDLSRERVRQIAKRAIEKLQSLEIKQKLAEAV